MSKHVHLCVYIYIYIYIHMYVSLYICMYIYIYIHTHAVLLKPAGQGTLLPAGYIVRDTMRCAVILEIHSFSPRFLESTNCRDNLSTEIPSGIYTYINNYIHMYIYIYICTYIHTRTCMYACMDACERTAEARGLQRAHPCAETLTE